MQRHIHSKTGRMQPDFLLAGTDTGRLSSRPDETEGAFSYNLRAIKQNFFLKTISSFSQIQYLTFLF
jgi:DNA polymerase I-like protein with 3'-5' exonuclease and polymerase domains